MQENGPAVVALGGGHGLATTLRASRSYAGRITAVVSVADDGGSSGRLREAFGLPAPGDLRRCLGALADDNSMLAQAFEHRFEGGDLDGHPVGNLLIAGLTAASGDFVAALAETGRLLHACGDVLPATIDPVLLKADANGTTISGQVAVDQTVGITRVYLEPPAPATPQAVTDAIASADQIVIGPGSLHTSLLAVLAVPDINAAFRATSKGRTTFIANLRSVRSTAGWTLADHLEALAAHGIRPDNVLVDENSQVADGNIAGATQVVRGPIARIDAPAHDSVQLAKALADLVG